MVKFLWGTCFYLTPVHILWNSGASSLPSLYNVEHKLADFQSCTLFSLHFRQATLNGGEEVAREPRICDKNGVERLKLNAELSQRICP